MYSEAGCIGISLAKNIENAEVTLCDISEKALQIARKNAKSNYVDVKTIKSNMFEKINEKYDIIVSNPPYIETNTIKELSLQVQNEPIIALDGGNDGLEFYRILLSEASKYLNESGYLCMEIGYNQKKQILKIANETNKLVNIETIKDLSNNDRVIIAH